MPHNPDRPQPAEIRQQREPEPSTINEKTIADFTRVVEQVLSVFGNCPNLNQVVS